MSSSLLFSMLLKMDAGQAKAELASFTAATTKMGKEVGDLPTKVRPAKDAVDGLGSAYTSAGQASDKSAKLMASAALAASRADLLRLKSTDGATKEDIAAAQAAYNKANALDAAASAALAADRANNQMAGSATNLGRANQQAAGSVGNLIAQFNDIGVMIAAGQNPLQLAIQQGTQINQVIGPMGAAGAFKALGGAVLGMLNPVNFVTLAVIAGGAAFVQWAMSGEEATASVEDAVDAMNNAFRAYQDYAKTAAASTAELAKEFGAYAGQVQGFAEFMAQVQIGAVVQSSADVLTGLQQSLSGVLDLQSQADQVRDNIAKTATMVAQGFASPSDLLTAQEALALIESEAESAAEAIGLSALQAEIFSEKLNAVEAARIAGDTEAMAKAAFEASGYVQGLGLNVMDLPAPLQSALAALDSMQNVSATVTSGIGEGADEAGRLAENLRMAAGLQYEATAERTGLAGPDGVRSEQFGGGRFTPRVMGAGLRAPIPAAVSSGAGAGAANKEADSVAKLIEKLQGELSIARELDPVQREMAQYRDQLTGATDAESAAVEELIRLRQQEKQETEQLEYIQTQTGNALVDALMGGVDAGEQLIKTLMRAALQATLLGEGPLAGLFGGGGGLLGSLFSAFTGGAAPVGKADGGMIYGAGGPRDDMVPINASPGEFIVNARATHRHRALLEQLNSGQLASAPAFANGGIIGGNPSGSGGGPMDGAVFHAHFDLRGAQGDSAVQEAAKRGMDAALKEFARSELPSHVRRMSADPTVVRYG